ncbi:MAG: hypothetical protein V7K47_09415 [Nostoc sp.]
MTTQGCKITRSDRLCCDRELGKLDCCNTPSTIQGALYRLTLIMIQTDIVNRIQNIDKKVG